jgi:UDP-glucuronate decarboxylase
MMVDVKDFFPSVADRIPNIEELKDKKVLVTGASGLIGNHVLSTLQDIGAAISVVLNCHQPYHLKKSIAYNWSSLNQSDDKFDYIFHLAGYGQPQKFSNRKFNTIDINTGKLHDLFPRLEKGGSILFASTSEIYSGLTVEATEDMVGVTTPEHPRASYIESKRCGETLIHTLNETTAHTGKIARIALAYGPGVRYDDTRVMSDFIRMALEDGVIRPKGGLGSVRTYCYVTDTVEMLFNILLNGKETVYNVGGDFTFRLYELLHKIAEFTNAKIELLEEPAHIHKDAPDFVHICTGRYNNEFGEKQLSNIYWGLQETIKWFKYLKENRNG